jgi:large subunit ribosomal protein L19
MSHHLITKSKVVTSQLRSDIPDFKPGSVVEVHYKIKEGNKERIQVFQGLVTKRHGGTSLDATFTVLKNSTAGIKVERTFALHSLMIDKLVIVSGLQRARKSNVSYLRKVKDPVKTLRTKPLKVKS